MALSPQRSVEATFLSYVTLCMKRKQHGVQIPQIISRIAYKRNLSTVSNRPSVKVTTKDSEVTGIYQVLFLLSDRLRTNKYKIFTCVFIEFSYPNLFGNHLISI